MQIQCIKYYGSVRVYSKADYVNKCLIYQPLNLMGEFTYFQQGSWRFVSMRGTRITKSRADASYLFPANDEKRAGATKGIIHHFIEFKRGWSPFYAIWIETYFHDPWWTLPLNNYCLILWVDSPCCSINIKKRRLQTWPTSISNWFLFFFIII